VRNSETMRYSSMQAMRSDSSLRDPAQRSRVPSRAGTVEVGKTRGTKEKEPAANGIAEEEQGIGSAV